jgi:flavorubredoxin
VDHIPTSDQTEIMGEVFRSKAIALGSPTVINGMLFSVAGWLDHARALKFKGKKAAAFGCYGWSGESVKLMQAKLSEIGFDVIEANVRANWNPAEADYAAIPALVKNLLAE